MRREQCEQQIEIHPSKPAFEDVSASATLHPVWAEVLCDTDTPVGVYARLRRTFPSPFLFESVVGGERWSRFSVIGLGHRMHVRGQLVPSSGSAAAYKLEFDVELEAGFELPGVPRKLDGIEGLRQLMQRLHGRKQHGWLPPFWGGLVGVWGHDFVRAVENLPLPEHKPASGLPVVELVATDTLVVFDNLTQRVHVVATACPDADGGASAAWDAAAKRVRAVCKLLQDRGSEVLSLTLSGKAEVPKEPSAPWSQSAYLASVAKAKEHIVAGDIFQVVLAQGFTGDAKGVDALDVYRALRAQNPSPYMYLLELPAATLVGASPEVMARLERDTRQVTVRPIAGTRPRGKDAAEDAALEHELLADVKERAEHLMLIDLGRNDVGKVSVGGSVRMNASFCIERYSRVMHIASEVVGALRPELDAFDVLAATFPAGTLSGAPKVRALQIIDQLEAGPRGWYGGAVGYLGYDGGADLAICIRSAVISRDRFAVHAGAGVVHESDAEAEDRECRHKARAILEAINHARRFGENTSPNKSQLDSAER